MKSILIIEDEEVLLDILGDKFSEEGWEVDTASDGEEALKKIGSKTYRLLLLDLLMPRIDGFEVLKKVKNGKPDSGTPVIVMSNLGDDDTIQRAISLGATDYFIKNQHPLKKIIERAEELIAG